MPPTIRVVAVDLDGTLLRSDGTVSPRTRATLVDMAAAGVTTVFVTARPPRRLRPVAHEAGIGGLAICANGALVYDLTSDRIVRHSPLKASVARDLITALRRELPGICFATEAGLVYGQEPAYALHGPHSKDTGGQIADAIELLSPGGVTKLIALHPTHPPDVFLHLARDLAGAAAVVTHSGAPFIEIAAPGVTKAETLAILCAERGVTPDMVIAFGDMPNDLALLDWAGNAIAMGNAHSDVLALADEVTLSNDDDGVAVVLERLLANGLRLLRAEGH